MEVNDTHCSELDMQALFASGKLVFSNAWISAQFLYRHTSDQRLTVNTLLNFVSDIFRTIIITGLSSTAHLLQLSNKYSINLSLQLNVEPSNRAATLGNSDLKMHHQSGYFLFGPLILSEKLNKAGLTLNSVNAIILCTFFLF